MEKELEAINSQVSKFILTEREVEYLSLAGLGYKNYEIAIILVVSPSTVKKNIRKYF